MTPEEIAAEVNRRQEKARQILAGAWEHGMNLEHWAFLLDTQIAVTYVAGWTAKEAVNAPGQVTLAFAIEAARDLHDPAGGGNPHYTRGAAELIMDMFNLIPHDPYVRALIIGAITHRTSVEAALAQLATYQAGADSLPRGDSADGHCRGCASQCTLYPSCRRNLTGVIHG